MKIYFAADHAGFDLKNVLLNYARGELGHEVEDCGAFEKDINDDYPDVVAAACRMLRRDIQEGLGSRAVILGASGQGEAAAANRFNKIRAVVYYGAAGLQTDASGHELDMITSTREHNDSNVLSLGARFMTEEQAKQALKTWLNTPFTGVERHVRRIAKLDTLHGPPQI